MRLTVKHDRLVVLQEELLDEQHLGVFIEIEGAGGRIVRRAGLYPQHLHRGGVAVVLEHLLVGPDLFEAGLDLQHRLVDERARPLAAGDGSLVLEATEGVADRGPGHPEVLGELGLGRNAPVDEPIVEDEVLDVGLHLLGEGGVTGDHVGKRLACVGQMVLWYDQSYNLA